MTQEEHQTAMRNEFYTSILKELEAEDTDYDISGNPLIRKLESLGPLGLIETLAREYVGNSDFNRDKLMEIVREL